MKKVLNLFLVALAGILVLGMPACGGDDGPVTGKFTPGEGGGGEEPPVDNGGLAINPADLKFTAIGSVKPVSIIGKEWEATPGEDWIGVEQTGEGIDVTVGYSDRRRNGTITVTNGSDTQTITVSQLVESHINANPGWFQIPAAGDTRIIKVYANIDWTASSDEGWITLTPLSETDLQVEIAPTQASKEGKVTIRSELDDITIDIYQDADTPSGIATADLVGTYTTTGWYQQGGYWVSSAHEVTVTQIDATTLKFDRFLGSDQLQGARTGTFEDSITATFDDVTGTLDLGQKQTGSVWYARFTNFLAPFRVGGHVCNNFDLLLPTYPVVKTGNVISIDFQDPEGASHIEYDYNYGKTSFGILYSSDGMTCQYGGPVFIGTKFTKVVGQN